MPCNNTNFDDFKWAELVKLYQNHVIPKEQRVYRRTTIRNESLSSSQKKHRELIEKNPNLKRKMDATTGLPVDPNVASQRIKLTSPTKQASEVASSNNNNNQHEKNNISEPTAPKKSRISWP